MKHKNTTADSQDKNAEPVSLSRRWSTYALAGAAATLMPGTAAADITLIEPSVELVDGNPGDGEFGLPFRFSPGTGVQLDFLHGFSETAPGEGQLVLSGSAISFAGFSTNGYVYGQNLAFGQQIVGLDFVSASASNLGNLAFADGYSNSQFLNRSGFIGFRFDLGSGTQHGWARLELNSGTPENIFTLTSLAYASAGKSIFAGQTSTVPEVGSMALLSLGAAGLTLWRRRRNSPQLSQAESGQ